jgi:hypothetical protein
MDVHETKQLLNACACENCIGVQLIKEGFKALIRQSIPDTEWLSRRRSRRGEGIEKT